MNHDQQATLKLLNWAYEKAVCGFAKTKSAQELADEYLRREGTLEEKIDALIRSQTAKSAVSGFLTGLGGLPTLPFSVPASILSSGARVCGSNTVKADVAENYVVDRIPEVVQKPKVLEEIVAKINKDRVKSVVPLQKEVAAIDKELKTIEAQRNKYFKLYESDAVDNDFLLGRLNELKAKHDVLTRRKSEAERQLADNVAEPVPLQQVRSVLDKFHELLESSPVETQKTLLQTIVKQIFVQKGQKFEGIELEFDEQVKKCFLGLAPSTKTVEGAFAFPKQKLPSMYTIVI